VRASAQRRLQPKQFPMNYRKTILHVDDDPQLTRLAVVVQYNRGSLCIRVDNVVGHRQVVVTALNEILPDSTKLTGIAQLGGGRLAPVLNIPEIVKSLV